MKIRKSKYVAMLVSVTVAQLAVSQEPDVANSGEVGYERRDVPSEIENPIGRKGLPAPYQWDPSRQWLSDAPDTETALRRAENYLGGMAFPMFEVGQRFEQLYEAVEDENWEFAQHQAQTLTRLILSGSMTRPRFKALADAMFLRQQGFTLISTMRKKDQAVAFQVLEQTRQTCMACHTATRFDYLNKTRLFKRLEPENWFVDSQ